MQVFSEVVTDCYDFIDEASGRPSKLIADDVYGIIMANKVWPPKPSIHLSPHGWLSPHGPQTSRLLPRVPPPHVPMPSRCLPPPACRNVACNLKSESLPRIPASHNLPRAPAHED